jgi:hypothetical protein
MNQFVADVCSAHSVLSQFPLRCQKAAAAMMIAPAVNQFTPIQVVRSRWTREIGL